MNNAIITILTFLFASCSVGQKKYEQFPFREYDKVVAYSFNLKLRGEAHEIVDKQLNILNLSAERPGVVLTKDQIARILKTLNDTATYLGTGAACFEPRMGLVFYKKDSFVADVSICFECNNLKSTPEIQANSIAHDKGFFGLSNQGRNNLRKFCNEFELKRCNDFSELFDTIPQDKIKN